MKSIIILIALLAGQARAADVSISNNRCVLYNADTVHKRIVDYDSYKDLDDGIVFDLNLNANANGLIKIPAIDMVKSQSRFETVPGRNTLAKVLVTLQPMNVSDGSVYPRFVMQCQSTWVSDTSFNHQCDILPQYPTYGLVGFSSRLSVIEKPGSCANGSHLDYSLLLRSESSHITAIKGAVTQELKKKFAILPANVLRGAVDRLFDEETFFKSYYTEFYNRWLSSLR
ncbi:MAG: hypothetical protein IT289_10795 [Oligoflexia bacterium]|nr:hypothetical protein [Oligoflexia bacterium]